MKTLLEFRSISKSFQGVQALKDVSIAVREGTVLGLVGENGAGKSTLMNVLGGIVPSDEGDMMLDDEPYAPSRPAHAERAGIAFIHQELNLFPSLSVADNLFISGFPCVGRLPWIDRRRLRLRARRLLDTVGLSVPPDTSVEKLAPGERQLVEIARAVGAEARLVLFDEPTTSLTAREKRHLFQLIRHLRDGGATIIFISHDLRDVLALADDVVVLRDGELVDKGPKAEFTVDRMITAMVGRRLEQLFPPRRAEPASEVVLDVRDVSQRGIVHEINLSLRRGEILGVFGLMGSGRTELAQILFGLDSFERGEVRLQGRRIDRLGPRERIRAGMAFVTEKRRDEGLLMDGTLLDNVGIASLSRFARTRLRLVDRVRLRDAVSRTAGRVRIRFSDLGVQPVRQLSGGNQQKAVLAKWLLTEPTVLILDEPTRGVDVGAKFEIYTIIQELAEGGAGILCISSEIEELIGICDRILVMSRGRITGSFERDAFDEERMLRAAFAEHTPQPAQEAREQP